MKSKRFGICLQYFLSFQIALSICLIALLDLSGESATAKERIKIFCKGKIVQDQKEQKGIDDSVRDFQEALNKTTTFTLVQSEQQAEIVLEVTGRVRPGKYVDYVKIVHFTGGINYVVYYLGKSEKLTELPRHEDEFWRPITGRAVDNLERWALAHYSMLKQLPVEPSAPGEIPADVADQIDKLNSENSVDRGYAVQQLGKMGARASAAVPRLVALMNDGSTLTYGGNQYAITSVGRLAAEALVYIAPDSLFPAARDSSRPIAQQEAVRIFGSFNHPKVVDILIENLKLTNAEFVRQQAASHLISHRERRVIEALIESLRDPKESVRKTVRQSLQKLTSQDFKEDQQRWRGWWATNQEQFPSSTPKTTPAVTATGETVQPAQLTTQQPAPSAQKASEAPAAEKPMLNKDVVELVKAGLDEENTIATIEAAKLVQFDLSAEQINSLLAGGVTNKVISAMRNKMKSAN